MALPLLGIAVRGALGAGRTLTRAGTQLAIRLNSGRIVRDSADHVLKETHKHGTRLRKNLRAKTPKGSSKRASNGWKKTDTQTGYRIKNDVPYIGALNEGSSPQAPKGFVQKTIQTTR